MAIELIDVDDMKIGRGTGKRVGGKKYHKYIIALEKAKLVPFLKESLEKQGTIRLKTKDIVRELGGDFASKHSTSIYWGLKYILFHEGIVVTTGKHVDGDDVLVMREGTPEDKLPDSLTKGRFKEGEEPESEEPESEEPTEESEPGEEEDDDK